MLYESMPYIRKKEIQAPPQPISTADLRSIFLETLVEIALGEGLGITAKCLKLIEQMVNDVLKKHLSELSKPGVLNHAFADFEEFVLRMVADARAKGLTELHEDTFSQAKSQCGLIFWCA